jgi:hypothetical protein
LADVLGRRGRRFAPLLDFAVETVLDLLLQPFFGQKSRFDVAVHADFAEILSRAGHRRIAHAVFDPVREVEHPVVGVNVGRVRNAAQNLHLDLHHLVQNPDGRQHPLTRAPSVGMTGPGVEPTDDQRHRAFVAKVHIHADFGSPSTRMHCFQTGLLASS